MKIKYNDFKSWLEAKDVFGFDKELYMEPRNISDERPIHSFDLEHLMNNLHRYQVGALKPYSENVSQIEWGTGSGALRVRIGTGWNIMFERMAPDLEGTNRWGCKRVYQIPQSGYGGHEDAVAQEIIEIVNELHQQPLDSASNDFDNLEGLVSAMANTLKKTARDIFIFEGVRKVNDEDYIIRFSLRGSGVEAPNQARVEEHQTRLMFDKNTGLLRMIDYNIESPVGKRTWDIMPNDTDWYFFPTQSMEEIIETISNTLHWY